MGKVQHLVMKLALQPRFKAPCSLLLFFHGIKVSFCLTTLSQQEQGRPARAFPQGSELRVTGSTVHMQVALPRSWDLWTGVMKCSSHWFYRGFLMSGRVTFSWTVYGRNLIQQQLNKATDLRFCHKFISLINLKKLTLMEYTWQCDSQFLFYSRIFLCQ